jgi:PAS domain S-box-containing protein
MSSEAEQPLLIDEAGSMPDVDHHAGPGDPPGSDDAGELTAAAIRLLSERSETVLNSIAGGVYCLDTEGRTIFVNEAGARIFGYSPREMLGRSQHELVHHHYADGSEFPLAECPIFASVTEGITQHVGSDVFWHKDGKPVPVDYTSIPLKDGRRTVGAVVTIRDISAEHRAEKQQALLDRERTAREEVERSRAALEASEERLRLAMSAGQMASWEWDLATGQVLWSPEEEALHGLEPGTFDGTTEGYASRIHPDDRDIAFRAMHDALAARAETYSVVYRVVWPDGGIRWLESHGRFVHATAENPTRLVCVSRDVTHRKRKEAESAAAQHQLESVLEAAPSAISVTEGPDHVLRWANRVSRELMGRRAVIGMPAREIFPELVEQGFLEIIDDVYETGESFSADNVEVLWDPAGSGEVRAGRFNIVYQALRGADGGITGVMTHAVACGG